MNTDLQIQSYLNHLQCNGNMFRLATNYDNARAPIHRWFPFLAGFSNKLVGDTFDFFSLNKGERIVYDPFMGSGTTGVVGKEYGIKVIGSETNKLLHRICKLKTDLILDFDEVHEYSLKLLERAKKTWKNTDVKSEKKLLKKCYPNSNLKKLVTLKKMIEKEAVPSKKCLDYMFMAVTMALPKASNVGINVPYVSWSHAREPKEAFELVEYNLNLIKEDLSEALTKYKNNSETKVYLHDSRERNNRIPSNSVNAIFTSPPYLNNFDYGESLKVYLYFWDFVDDWADITKKIRLKSIASATTHYKEHKFNNEKLKKMIECMGENLPKSSQEILGKVRLISEKKIEKDSSKSFDILVGLYFSDMAKVLKEMHRVLTSDSLAFIVIGDSAPFGIHIPTDTLLGEMSVETGFSSFTLQPLRERGTKWKTLTYRHKLKLRESLLILRK